MSYPLHHDPTVTRHGVCSTFLSTLPALSSGPRGAFPGFIWKSTFRMPPRPADPLVCIAGGTGVAPFKAFMEERRILQAREPGAAWGPFELYYGVRDPTEYAYADEIKQVSPCWSS